MLMNIVVKPRCFMPTVDAPKDVIIPERKTKYSAGYDLCTTEEIVIEPYECVVVKTYIKAIMPDDEYLAVVPRSSLFRKHGLIMPNNVGIIDADYANNADNDGNIGVILLNLTNVKQYLEKHEAIAQGIFNTYEITGDDKAKGVRTGGFGSTDKR